MEKVIDVYYPICLKFKGHKKYIVSIVTKPLIFSKILEEKKVFDFLKDALIYAEELKEKYGYSILPHHGGYIYSLKNYLKLIN